MNRKKNPKPDKKSSPAKRMNSTEEFDEEFVAEGAQPMTTEMKTRWERARRNPIKKQCLICEKEIATDSIAVCDATVWQCTGNYGSTVYDPVNDRVFLEALICDACLIQKKHLVEEVVVKETVDVLERRTPDF